jgi:toxin ParE1/3/4
MVRVIRSSRAKRDIADVLRYTKERWGEPKAREYRDLIKEALNTIAADPQRGIVRSGVRPGILGYHIQRPGRNARHILFYRVNRSGVVELIRFLHDSMDFQRHLP